MFPLRVAVRGALILLAGSAAPTKAQRPTNSATTKLVVIDGRAVRVQTSGLDRRAP